MRYTRNKALYIKKYLNMTDQIKTQQRFRDMGFISGVLSVVQTRGGADLRISVPRPSNLAKFFDRHQDEILRAIASDSLKWDQAKRSAGERTPWQAEMGEDGKPIWTLRKHISWDEITTPPQQPGQVPNQAPQT